MEETEFPSKIPADTVNVTAYFLNLQK